MILILTVDRSTPDVGGGGADRPRLRGRLVGPCRRTMGAGRIGPPASSFPPIPFLQRFAPSPCHPLRFFPLPLSLGFRSFVPPPPPSLRVCVSLDANPALMASGHFSRTGTGSSMLAGLSLGLPQARASGRESFRGPRVRARTWPPSFCIFWRGVLN